MGKKDTVSRHKNLSARTNGPDGEALESRIMVLRHRDINRETCLNKEGFGPSRISCLNIIGSQLYEQYCTIIVDDRGRHLNAGKSSGGTKALSSCL